MPISVGPRLTLPVVVFGALMAARCASPTRPSPVTPPPPTPTPAPDPLTLTCPASPTVAAAVGLTATVNYDAPTGTGGTAPVTIDCNPSSGTPFPLGPSAVTCTATDAAKRTSSCAFVATVFPTRFVAFGDSLTEGKLSSGEIIPGTYPANLQSLLINRYNDQTIRVKNEGLGGKTAAEDVDRFAAVLNADNPQAVLLLEGINDLNSGDPSKVASVANALRNMVRQARGRGALAFLATLLPERPGGSRAGAVSLIPPENDQIRQIALSEGATLIDLYQGFNGSPDPYIGDDGLHPTAPGYAKMADIFFGGIDSWLRGGPATLWHGRIFEP